MATHWSDRLRAVFTLAVLAPILLLVALVNRSSSREPILVRRVIDGPDGNVVVYLFQVPLAWHGSNEGGSDPAS